MLSFVIPSFGDEQRYNRIDIGIRIPRLKSTKSHPNNQVHSISSFWFHLAEVLDIQNFNLELINNHLKNRPTGT